MEQVFTSRHFHVAAFDSPTRADVYDGPKRDRRNPGAPTRNPNGFRESLGVKTVESKYRKLPSIQGIPQVPEDLYSKGGLELDLSSEYLDFEKLDGDSFLQASIANQVKRTKLRIINFANNPFINLDTFTGEEDTLLLNCKPEHDEFTGETYKPTVNLQLINLTGTNIRPCDEGKIQDMFVKKVKLTFTNKDYQVEKTKILQKDAQRRNRNKSQNARNAKIRESKTLPSKTAAKITVPVKYSRANMEALAHF